MSPPHTRRRIAVAAGIGLLLAMLVGGPAVADSELGHTGTIGVHSLVDSLGSPGATCKYRLFQDSVDFSYDVIKQIIVRPPRVRAISGVQRVGWRFAVERRETPYNVPHTPTSWHQTYLSPVWTSMTDASHDAPFTRLVVRIRGAGNAADSWSFRVLVTMLWYYNDGSTQGTAVHKVNFYRHDHSWGSSNDGLSFYLCDNEG